jgi:hypothetical protein
VVEISTEHDRAQWSHEKAGAERHECRQEAGGGVIAWKKSLRDVLSIKAEQEKVEHFEEIAAGDPDHSGELGGWLAAGRFNHSGLSRYVYRRLFAKSLHEHAFGCQQKYAGTNN